jgi:ECF transporter S component (folate family)
MMNMIFKKYLSLFALVVMVSLIFIDAQLSETIPEPYLPLRLYVFGGVFLVILLFAAPYASTQNTSQLIRRITLSGMLIAIAIILERFVSIPIGLTNRIAFGSAIVIASSLVVGPFYGMIVGAATDIFGFMIFNATGLAFTPFVTVGYVVLGFLPYFLYRAFQGTFFQKYGIFLLQGLLLVISFYAIYFAYANETFTFRNGPEVLIVELDQLWFRIVGPIVLLTVFIGFAYFVQWLKTLTQKSSIAPMTIALSVFIVEVLVTIIWGGLWRSIYFGASQWVFFFTQTGFFVIGYPVKTLLVYFLYQTYVRYNLGKEVHGKQNQFN